MYFGFRSILNAPFFLLVGKAIVLHPYEAEGADELSLLRGEYVEILDREVDDGWWKGLNERGESGVFPNNFVRELDEEAIAPPTPTRARRSINTTENRPSSTSSSMAKPPQVPRPASVQTPTTARPISVQSPAQRPSSVSHTNIATPPKVSSPSVPQHVTSPTIAEDDAMSEEEEMAVVTDTDQPPTPTTTVPIERQPSLASEKSTDIKSPVLSPVGRQASEPMIQTMDTHERKASLLSGDESATLSPPIISEDPISDVEEKESGAEEIPSVFPVASREIKHDEQPKEEEHDVKESAPVEEEIKEPVKEIETKEITESIKEPVESKEHDELKDTTEPIAESKVAESKKEDESTSDNKENIEPKEIIEESTPVKEEEPEEKNEFDIIPTGPKLTAPTRARIGGGRARRSPQTPSTEPSQTEILQQQVLEQKEEPKEEVKEEQEEQAPSPPAKPVKPIFAKFPTPFASGAAISKSHLKPTQTRKLWEEKPAEESRSEETRAEPTVPPKPSGVKNIASRFNFAGNTGGGSNEVLETKLKNHTKNEVEKVKKEFEHLLNEEREKRVALEDLVQALLQKVNALEQS